MKFSWIQASAFTLTLVGLAMSHSLVSAQGDTGLRSALLLNDPSARTRTTTDDDAVAPTETADDAGLPEATAGEVQGREAELIRQRFPDGSVKIERQVAQDEEGNYFNHGVWREFTQKGQLLAEGEYRMGQRVGDWNRWVNPASHKDLQGADFNGFRAPFMSSATFDDGELNGNWLIIDAEQKTILQIELKHGVRDGLAVWYYPNGERRRQVGYTQGVIDGVAMSWKDDKTVAGKDVYIDGRRQVHNQTFYDGQKSKPKTDENFLAARLVPVQSDDYWNLTFADYKPEGVELREGEWATWHPNGLPQMRGRFQNDQPIGEMTWWYTNGQVKLQGQFRDGQRDTQWTWWHENGMKATQGTYRDGEAAGLWTWWTADGRVSKKVDLDQQQGVEVSSLQDQ